ncbi:MAG TPA: hypothetical protein VL551_08235 [Actinospica sp.]|jgi:hypothetical protein|nr:hypothetical protein [Actinospica sp.]
MTGSTRSLRRRRTLGSVLAAGAVGALLVTGAAACASTGKSVSVSAGGSATSPSAAGTTASPSPSASASSSGSAASSGTPSVNPGGIDITPRAQTSTTSASTKFTAFESAGHSADGRTLYLGIESQGGACGQYDVVLQQSSSTVSVGLVHLSSGGKICPMYVAHMVVKATLAAPLNGRRVVDLANGQTMESAQVG